MGYQREPAPEDLAGIESFCNSAAFLHGQDSFSEVESARSWLREHGHLAAAKSLDTQALAFLVEVREAVRGHLEGDAEARRQLNECAARLLGPPQWNIDGAAYVPEAEKEEGAVSAVAAGVLSALAVAGMEGRRARRLKVCRSSECRWVFYDQSPANNSIWCSMDICGARHKMRLYRSRRKKNNLPGA